MSARCARSGRGHLDPRGRSRCAISGRIALIPTVAFATFSTADAVARVPSRRAVSAARRLGGGRRLGPLRRRRADHRRPGDSGPPEARRDHQRLGTLPVRRPGRSHHRRLARADGQAHGLHDREPDGRAPSAAGSRPRISRSRRHRPHSARRWRPMRPVLPVRREPQRQAAAGSGGPAAPTPLPRRPRRPMPSRR